MNIGFSVPDITQKEIDNVVEVLKSGWITTGPKTKEFEKELSEFNDTSKTICLNSQTACAETALRILGIGKGDEVITSAYTYTASASIIDHVEAKIIMIDTQKDNLEMDYDALEKAITNKTKAIIPIDIAGIPCDYDKIFDIVERKKELFNPNNELQEKIGRVAIIADTAHSLGAEYKGKKTGSIADFSAFSFHAVKNLTTAEGGALTWNSIKGYSDEDIYKKGQLISLHGQTKDALSKIGLGTWEYDIVEPLYKLNMTDIMAGIGLAQLERYPDLLLRRKEIISMYDKAFKNLGIKTLNHYSENHTSSGHLYITRIPGITSEERNDIIIEMAESGIACNVHYKPLPLLTAYKNLGFNIKDYPNAYNNYVNEITLPLHTLLTNEEVEYVIEKYTQITKKYLNR